MKLATFAALLQAVPSWDWHLIDHAAVKPGNCHPSCLKYARSGIEMVMATAQTEGDAELVADCKLAIQDMVKAAAGKIDKEDDVQDS